MADKSFGDQAVAMEMRDIIRSIAKEVLEEERPKERYGTVSSINRNTRKAQVRFPGDDQPVTVNMGATQPASTNQKVRVGGQGADRYIEDVIGDPHDPHPPTNQFSTLRVNGNANLNANSGATTTRGITADGNITSFGIVRGELFRVGTNTVIDSNRGIAGTSANILGISEGRRIHGNQDIFNYGSTTGTSNPNVFWSPSSGRFHRSSSARRAKLDINDAALDPTKILDIKFRDWWDKFEVEEYSRFLECDPEDDEWSDLVDGISPIPFKRVPGLVAEELEEVGLEQFVSYEVDYEADFDLDKIEEGGLPLRTSSVMYDRLWILLVPLVKELREKASVLEKENSELKDRLEKLEAAVFPEIGARP